MNGKTSNELKSWLCYGLPLTLKALNEMFLSSYRESYFFGEWFEQTCFSRSDKQKCVQWSSIFIMLCSSCNAQVSKRKWNVFNNYVFSRIAYVNEYVFKEKVRSKITLNLTVFEVDMEKIYLFVDFQKIFFGSFQNGSSLNYTRKYLEFKFTIDCYFYGCFLYVSNDFH